MQEYPKRIYLGGKGITISSPEEEKNLFEKSVTVASTSESAPEPKPATDEDKTEEAIEYIMSKGYNKKAAKQILKKEGLEAILAAKAEGAEPQE